MRVEVLVWIKDKIRGRYLWRHMDLLADSTAKLSQGRENESIYPCLFKFHKRGILFEFHHVLTTLSTTSVSIFRFKILIGHTFFLLSNTITWVAYL